MRKKIHAAVKHASRFLRAWDGPLTRDLVLTPGAFGLGKVPLRLKPDATTTSVCGYCSTGCGLNIHLKDGQAVNLSADTSYPVNLGMACPKGWEALTPLAAGDRATAPLLRQEGGAMKEVGWNDAIAVLVKEFKAIQEKHGNESLAFLSTGQIVSEEMLFLGSLAKFGMGMIHGDGNTRQCMATAVTAYKESFGFDAPPFTYADFEESDVLVFVGSNLCIAHPIMWQRVCRNPHRPEIIVIDPRKTETAMAATQHFAIRPKSDLVLLYGLAHVLVQKNWIRRDYIEAHTVNFEAFAEFVQEFNPGHVAQITGIAAERILQLAECIHQGKRVSFWWTMGVNQGHEATRTAQAIINLALMTGNMGRPGTGANSVTGQCNAMGSRMFSNTTGLAGGHDFTKKEDREKVALALDIPADRIPDRNSLAYDQILEGIDQGRIKGLWVIATNSAHSWIHQNKFKELIAKLDFLVVQDMYHSTETAQLADLVLPAAGWGEKDGTFINSERRIGLCKKVSRAPGKALADFHIFKLVAEAWGCGNLFKDWQSPEDVFGMMQKISKGQPCDITGIEGYHDLEKQGGIQWPFVKAVGAGQSGERRLFEDGRYFHKDGKARFIFEAPREAAELPDQDYPFFLLTGRGTSSQWHTQTRTGKSDVLKKLYPSEIYVEIHPSDAKRLGIGAGEWVDVSSRRGSLLAKANVTAVVQVGQVFIPMHYATTNQLTYPSVDPYSRQPSYKASAVKINRSSVQKGKTCEH